mgnify:CR=1 FL=1|jgi:hypothetical protein
MKMAIQVAGTEVIDNALQLKNVASTDTTTDTAINNSIKNQANVLTVYNAAGTIIAAYYCAL